MGLLMLDTTATVAAITWAPPGNGQSEPTPSKQTRSVQMRVQTISGELLQSAVGKRADATHKAFADPDAALEEGEMVGVAAGPYAGYRWEIVHRNPVHGHHFEVEMKRIPVDELVDGSDPLA